MNDVMTKKLRTQPTAKQLRLMALKDAMLADWRKRWPAAFTKPVPLAVGIDEQMKAVLHAEGQTIDRMLFWKTIRHWTKQNAYLRALARGEIRRNLDGTEAGLPVDDARKAAQRLLDERAARRAERERLNAGNCAQVDCQANDESMTTTAKKSSPG